MSGGDHAPAGGKGGFMSNIVVWVIAVVILWLLLNWLFYGIRPGTTLGLESNNAGSSSPYTGYRAPPPAAASRSASDLRNEAIRSFGGVAPGTKYHFNVGEPPAGTGNCTVVNTGTTADGRYTLSRRICTH